MLKKLKSVLGTHRGSLSVLALKAGIFSSLLYLIDGQWLMVAAFLAVAFYFYFQLTLNVRQFPASFLIIIIISLLVVNLPMVSGQLSVVASLFFGFLFFLLLGIKNLIFIKREPLYYLLNGFLLLTVFAFFFSLNYFYQPFWFLIKSLAVFLATYCLFKEFLAVVIPGQLGSQKRNLMAGGSAFLSLQFTWTISFLPFSVINAASLALLIALILEDFIIHHLSGTLNRQITLRNTTMFLVLAMIIFGASKWSP